MQRLPQHLWWVVLLGVAPATLAREPVTVERVLQLAREAPQVRRAEIRVAESAGRLTGAEVWSAPKRAPASQTVPRWMRGSHWRFPWNSGGSGSAG
jgi:hypothetical protein